MRNIAAGLTGSAATGQEYTDRLIRLVDNALHGGPDSHMAAGDSGSDPAFAEFVEMVMPVDAESEPGSFHAELEAHFGPGITTVARRIDGETLIEVSPASSDD